MAATRTPKTGDPEKVARDRLEEIIADPFARMMIDEIVETALTAGALEPDKANIATAVRRLGRAEGVGETYEAAMQLSAAALAFAFRIGPRYRGQDTMVA